MVMQRRFKVILEWNEDDGGGYTVIVPALPGCITEGDTVEEAMNNAHEAITGYLEALKLQGVEEAMNNAHEAITGYLEALKLQGKPLPKKDTRMFFGEVEVLL
jgi:antitoxin HicB